MSEIEQLKQQLSEATALSEKQAQEITRLQGEIATADATIHRQHEEIHRGAGAFTIAEVQALQWKLDQHAEGVQPQH